MARSKRRFKTRSRVKSDWVYRGDVHDSTGALVEDLGTYTPANSTLAGGVGSALGKVLYDSHNYIKSANVAIAPGLAPAYLSSSARAEGSRARILRVQGSVFVRPSTWTIGSTFRLGFRFGFFEQDAETGVVLVDPLYSMWNATVVDDTNPARWANDRAWQHERRDFQTFATGNEMTSFRYWFNFRVNRSLRPNQAYVMYLESQADSATLLVQRWLRTLVVDEG